MYSFGELKKTIAATGGLLGTIAAYVVADETLRSVIPPQAVVVIGGLATIFGVFKTENAAAPTPDDKAIKELDKAASAVQEAHDYAAKKAAEAKAARQRVDAAVRGIGTNGDLAQRVIDSVTDA